MIQQFNSKLVVGVWMIHILKTIMQDKHSKSCIYSCDLPEVKLFSDGKHTIYSHNAISVI